MSKATNVPTFGKWEMNDPTTYTVLFDKARADHKDGTGAGKKMFNPNDPSENPAIYGIKSIEDPPSSRNPSRQQHYVDELGRRVDPIIVGPNVSGDPTRSKIVGGHAKKGSNHGMRANEGVGFGEGHYAAGHPSLPLEGHLGNRPASQPSYHIPDRKGAHEGGTPHHHSSKTRLRPGSRGEDMKLRERSSVLPKFGAWNENDPSSGDGYTLIFNNAREEKVVGGPAPIPAYAVDSPLKVDDDADDAYKPPHQRFHEKAVSWICCFRQ